MGTCQANNDGKQSNLAGANFLFLEAKINQSVNNLITLIFGNGDIKSKYHACLVIFVHRVFNFHIQNLIIIRFDLELQNWGVNVKAPKDPGQKT